MPTCDDEKLHVKLGELELKNPIIVESAGYIVDSWSMKRMIRTGAGAVITKSTTWHPQGGWPRRWEWSPRPRNYWNLADGTMLTSAFPEDPGHFSGMDGTEALLNPGYKRMARAIREAKPLAEEENCRIIGSFSPRSVEEGVQIAREFERAGASAIHMDLCCPSAKWFREKQLPGQGYEKLGCWWSEDTGRIIELLKTVTDSVEIPVCPKPTFDEWIRAGQVENIKKLDQTKADAYALMLYVVPDTVWIDVYRGKPVSPAVYVPLPALVPVTVGMMARLAKTTSKDVVVSGGVSTTNDVLSLLMVGASAVGVCRAFYKDIDVCKKICEGLEYYIVSQALNSISDIKGAALPHMESKTPLPEEVYQGAYEIPVPPVDEEIEVQKRVPRAKP